MPEHKKKKLSPTEDINFSRGERRLKRYAIHSLPFLAGKGQTPEVAQERKHQIWFDKLVSCPGNAPNKSNTLPVILAEARIQLRNLVAVILAHARIQRRNIVLDYSESWNGVVSSLINRETPAT
jgi:hypothetical protein